GAMLISTLPLFFLPEGGVDYNPAAEGPSDDRRKTTLTATTVFLVFLVGMVFINFGRNSIAIIFTQYLTLDAGLDLDSRTLSQIVNTQSLAIVALGWTVGWLCLRIGNGFTMLAGTLAAVAGLCLLTFSTALPVIFAACFLRGIGDAVIMAAAYTFASVLIPPQMRGRLFAWFNGTFFLSFGVAGTLIAGPIVDGLISAGYAEPWAYRFSFAAAAGLTIIGLLIQAGLLWSLKKQRNAVLAANGVNPDLHA
ncbi:MAG: MFS transporter, partial [Desulfobacterales bacterium]|nr:MFS transporter [Desulfobacterales bacterium]